MHARTHERTHQVLGAGLHGAGEHAVQREEERRHDEVDEAQLALGHACLQPVKQRSDREVERALLVALSEELSHHPLAKLLEDGVRPHGRGDVARVQQQR
jgi:hypothetical protein